MTHRTRTPRTQARLAGDRTYVDRPCKRGHAGLRYTSSGACVQCQRERAATLGRLWRARGVAE